MGESEVFNRVRAEEKLETMRGVLIRLLQKKYRGAMTADFKQTIEQQTDAALLERWCDLVIEQDTWDDFVASLR